MYYIFDTPDTIRLVVAMTSDPLPLAFKAYVYGVRWVGEGMTSSMGGTHLDIQFYRIINLGSFHKELGNCEMIQRTDFTLD